MSTTKRTRSTGSVRQRGDSWTAYWWAPDEHGNNRQCSKGGFNTAEEAERHLRTKLAQKDKGGYVEPTRTRRAITLAPFVRSEYLPTVKRSKRAKTHASYRDTLELHVLPALGDLQLRRITTKHVNDLYDQLLEHGRRKGSEQGLSVTTVRYVGTVLRLALTYAVEQGYLGVNPCERATPPRAQHVEMKTWDAEQSRQFLNRARGDRLYGAYVLAFTTGARRGEVLGVRWQDLDFEAGLVSFAQALVTYNEDGATRIERSEPKTGAGRRTIALDPATVTALRAHRARQAEERLAWGEAWTDVGLVFTAEDGTPLPPGTLSRAFTALAKRAGLPPIRFHDIRHSYATAARTAGVPIEVVSRRLGHARPSITSDVYSHVTPRMDDEAAARVASTILG
jgi:integrase